MPQISKGARLIVYRRKGRAPVYAIRDGRFFRSTGCRLDERPKAEEALADYITSRRPDTSRRHTHEIGVAEVLNLYQMDLPQNKPSRELIGYHVANLLRYWGDKSLAQVKGSTCRSYVQFRTASGSHSQGRSSVKTSTARRELKTLSAAINHWHKESPLATVPKVTLPEEGERRERVLERSEVARMLWACRKRKWDYVARFILIGVYTGTRLRAAVALRWSSALQGGHVDVKRGVIFRRGAAEPETSKRRPPVQVGRRLAAHLERWRRLDAEKFSTVIHYQGQPVRKLRRSWRTICKDASLGHEVTPHVLRHTCCSWLLWKGWTIWDVAGHVGADASTIERTYGHHLIKDERKKA
jgi:integrase